MKEWKDLNDRETDWGPAGVVELSDDLLDIAGGLYEASTTGPEMVTNYGGKVCV